MDTTKSRNKHGLGGLLWALAVAISAAAVAEEPRPDPSPALPVVYRSIPVTLAKTNSAPLTNWSAAEVHPSAGSTKADLTRDVRSRGRASRDVHAGRTATPRTHTVKRGETLYEIGTRYRVSPRLLGELNAVVKPSVLRIGTVLRVPPPYSYRIRPGDTYHSLARRFERSTNELRAANGGRPLKAGALMPIPPAKRK